MFHGSFVPASIALLVAFSASSALSTLSAPARTGPERVEARPIVSSLVDELQQELARKAVDEARTKLLVERLAAEFAVSGTKDRGPIVRALERCLGAKQQGKPDAELVCHAARALAGMAPESLPVLTRALENKPLLKEGEVGRTLALALGKTRDPAAVKPLLALLDGQDDGLVAAAGAALGEYEATPLALRKQIFAEALKALLQVKQQQESLAQQTLDPSSPRDAAAALRYDAIESALSTTLQRLSKQEARNAERWQRWWDKNKRADWDDKSKLS